MNRETYEETYNYNFFRRADGYGHWKKSQLRYGDALAAIGYALGWPTWNSIWRAFEGLTEHGKETKNLDAPAQLEVLRNERGLANRVPKQVLDIGGGRGEVTMAFRHLGIPVQAVEAHSDACDWFEWTWGKLFDGQCRRGVADREYLLTNGLAEYLHKDDLIDADTVLLVETLEHLEAKTFDHLWKLLVPMLERTKGRLIITNWLDYHPLKATGNEHCRETNDNLYDQLAEGRQTVYRRGSHLVLDF
jgi:hypothetical protein